MRADRFGPFLLVLGLIVGGVAGVGLLVGFEPARLPAALLNIAAYKLTFLAAGGLIAGGALLLRYGRRHGSVPSDGKRPIDAPPQLGEGVAPEIPVAKARARDRHV